MPDELEQLEAELQRLQPSAVPPDLMTRLRAAPVAAAPEPKRPKTPGWWPWLTSWRVLGWGVPATAVALLLLRLAWRPVEAPAPASLANASGIKADAVRVDHSLVASFDTIASLPDGEPVRFRCRQWQDEVMVRDQVHGVSVRQTTPRVEIIPVRFETY